MENCKLREGFNSLVTYVRNGFEKEEGVKVVNLKTVEETFDFVCDPTVDVYGVYFSLCDENIKPVRCYIASYCRTLEDYMRAYDWCVKGVSVWNR